MLDEPLVTVMTFGTPQEAAMAQGFLQNHDITSFVQGAEAATAMSYFGTAVGGVKLQAASSQAEEARRLLDEEFGSTQATEAWKCPKCGVQVDAGYEVCWSCETVMGDDVVPEPVAQEAEDDEWTIPEESAGRPSEAATTIDDTDEIVQRLWIASVIGVGIAPFALYAIFLLLKVVGREMSPKSTLKFYGSILCICMAFLFVWAVFRI